MSGGAPFVWHAHKDACDECSDRNGKAFRLYADVPAAHPNCQCRLTYAGPKGRLPKRRGYRPQAVFAMSATEATHSLDIGPGDVHEPTADTGRKTMTTPITNKRKRRGVDAKKLGKRVHVRADVAPGGRLSVRHMADGDTVCLLEGQAVSLSDKPVWIQIAKTGDFRGHPAGPFSLNERVFGEIIANFKATENRAVPIDFEHASEQDATSGTIPTDGAPAQGWIRDLKIQGSNLWGLVEWGDKAREYIRSGAYRFISPAIRFGAKDRVTGVNVGAKITSAGLTNTPYLDGMRPLAAKDTPGEVTVVQLRSGLAHAPHEYMPRVKAALGMHELCSMTECSDQFERLRDRYEDAAGDLGASPDGVQLSKYMHPLRDVVGAKPGDTWDEVFDAVQDLIDAAIDEHEIRDHGGAEGASMTDGADDGDGDEGDTTMGDKDVAVLLNEANSQVVNLTDANAKLTAEKAHISLKLDEANAKVAQQDTELKTLRETTAKHEEEKTLARVEEAFETYKDKKGLTDSSKKSMTIVLKADPKQFEEDYPRVKPNERHMLRSLTEKRDLPATTTGDPGSVANETITQTTKRLMREHKLTLEDAQDEARRLHLRLVG